MSEDGLTTGSSPILDFFNFSSRAESGRHLETSSLVARVTTLPLAFATSSLLFCAKKKSTCYILRGRESSRAGKHVSTGTEANFLECFVSGHVLASGYVIKKRPFPLGFPVLYPHLPYIWEPLDARQIGWSLKEVNVISELIFSRKTLCT